MGRWRSYHHKAFRIDWGGTEQLSTSKFRDSDVVTLFFLQKRTKKLFGIWSCRGCSFAWRPARKKMDRSRRAAKGFLPSNRPSERSTTTMIIYQHNSVFLQLDAGESLRSQHGPAEWECRLQTSSDAMLMVGRRPCSDLASRRCYRTEIIAVPSTIFFHVKKFWWMQCRTKQRTIRRVDKDV